MPGWSNNKEEDGRWMIDDGILQARSGRDDATAWICFELSTGRQTQDLRGDGRVIEARSSNRGPVKRPFFPFDRGYKRRA